MSNIFVIPSSTSTTSRSRLVENPLIRVQISQIHFERGNHLSTITILLTIPIEIPFNISLKRSQISNWRYQFATTTRASSPVYKISQRSARRITSGNGIKESWFTKLVKILSKAPWRRNDSNLSFYYCVTRLVNHGGNATNDCANESSEVIFWCKWNEIRMLFKSSAFFFKFIGNFPVSRLWRILTTTLTLL